jgi:cytochrome c553
MRPRLRQGLRIGLVLACLGAAAALLVAGSGVISVAASRGHFPFVELFLETAMRRSVQHHADSIEPPDLDSPDRLRLGAAHFHGGCAFCHGAPTIPISPVAQRMLPPPPDLRRVLRQWQPAELFWIVKHGLKYTGMPAWVSQQRDDEVWAVVAFLRRLPTLDPPAYRDLAFGPLAPLPPDGRRLAHEGAVSDAVGACARCHGAENRGPLSRLVPVIHGQTATFLSAALKAYAEGRRESGIMQPVARELSPQETRQVAAYYAGLTPPPRPTGEAPPDAAAVERGQLLATEGSAGAGIPACLTCHGGTGLDVYPRLLGQPAPYIVAQLRLLRAGAARRTETAAIMTPIAQRLSDRQIADVADYFASLAPEASAAEGIQR